MTQSSSFNRREGYRTGLLLEQVFPEAPRISIKIVIAVSSTPLARTGTPISPEPDEYLFLATWEGPGSPSSRGTKSAGQSHGFAPGDAPIGPPTRPGQFTPRVNLGTTASAIGGIPSSDLCHESARSARTNRCDPSPVLTARRLSRASPPSRREAARVGHLRAWGTAGRRNLSQISYLCFAGSSRHQAVVEKYRPDAG